MLRTIPPLAFVDLETTGGNHAVDRITEVAVVTLVDGVTRSWHRLVNPGARIPPFIERLTGITNAMVEGAPPFAEIAAELFAQIDGFLFVAHNARFDYGFLKSEFRRVGQRFRHPILCTVKLSRRLQPQYRQHGLDQLIVRHGLRVVERHRALGDAQAICDFWQAMGAEYGPQMLCRLVEELTTHSSLPTHLDEDFLETIPDRCGVYLFFGENDRPLYIGKSRRLHTRILAHFSDAPATAKETGLSQQVRRIEWVECAGEVGARLQETRLVKEHQPSFNRPVHRHPETCIWMLVDQGCGLLQPQLLPAGTLPGGTGSHRYGPFASPRSAHKALQTIVRDHDLCLATLGLEQVPPGQPCLAYPQHRCRGVCVGEESMVDHGRRLIAALSPHRVHPWPFPGAATLAEGDVLHVLDQWAYLGTIGTPAELAPILARPRPAFDPDIYRILRQHLAELQPLAGGADPCPAGRA